MYVVMHMYMHSIQGYMYIVPMLFYIQVITHINIMLSNQLAQPTNHSVLLARFQQNWIQCSRNIYWNQSVLIQTSFPQTASKESPRTNRREREKKEWMFHRN